MSVRLVFVTQKIDPDDPVLGFTVGWARALAARCERLVVIANEVRCVPPDLPAQVVSLGKEHGAPRWRRLATYLRQLERILATERPSALLAHMCPQYLNAAAPLLRLHGVPGLLWFAHPRDSWVLRIAERAATAVLTSLPGAFPFPSPKVRVIGQAIDTTAFASVPPPAVRPELQVLALGRVSPIKGLETVIAAVADLNRSGVPVHLRIVGPVTTPEERAHAERLRRLVAGSGAAVQIGPPLPPTSVPGLLAETDVLVNGTRAGSGDKVVLEAMAAGRLAVWSNPCFDGLANGLPLRLRYREDDHADLATVLRGICEAPPAVRAATAAPLRSLVVDRHSLGRWADNVLGIVADLSGHH